jgi:hypothetical protein
VAKVDAAVLQQIARRLGAPDANLFFEDADGVAQRGLRNAEAFSRPS